jgi:hypothetical protein
MRKNAHRNPFPLMSIVPFILSYNNNNQRKDKNESGG